MRDPRAAYDRFDIKIWRDKLQAELRASGLPTAIQKLTKEMVDSARVKALLGEADTVIRQLREMSREMSNVYEYVPPRYNLPSFDLVLLDEDALRHCRSKPNTTPQQEAAIKRVKYPKLFWKHGIG